MTEPELEGRGLSSASRRRFIWLGGGIAAGLLLVPDFSFASKLSGAVKRVSTGKVVKPTKTSSATRAAAANPARTTGKSSAKSASGSASKGTRTASSASKSSARAASQNAPHGRIARSARTRGATRGRGSTTARAAASEPAAELELPPSFAPGRAFSFGSGSPESRDMSFYCVHTGEQLNVDYYVDGRYEPDALRAIDHLLRDYHNDEICQFDPRVLNQLYDVRRALGSSEPFHVYSGYRSPETNESYRRLSGRVAEHSYHLSGQAIDIHLPGRDIRQIRNVAMAMRAGGVGYYPQEGFVHLDSGPVRRW
jgi:uncharacterized protein YcbK (DUF882 family)